MAEAISPPQGLEPSVHESLCQQTGPGSAFVDSTNMDCIPAVARSLFLVFSKQNMVHSPFFILVSSFALLCVEEAARPGGSLIRYEKEKGHLGGAQELLLYFLLGLSPEMHRHLTLFPEQKSPSIFWRY